jgi:hypothetical protein
MDFSACCGIVTKLIETFLLEEDLNYLSFLMLCFEYEK